MLLRIFDINQVLKEKTFYFHRVVEKPMFDNCKFPRIWTNENLILKNFKPNLLL